MNVLRNGSLGRRVSDIKLDPATGRPFIRIEGYRVITIDGERIGTVTSAHRGSLVIRCGRWPFRKNRLVAVDQAVVRDIDRSLIILATPSALPRLNRSGQTR